MRRTDAHHGTRVIVLPAARREARGAYLWYGKANPQAADSFQVEFQEALLRLAEAPLRWAEVEPGIRRFLMLRHPYTIRYRVRDAHVEVISIMHHARHPDTGRHRR